MGRIFKYDNKYYDDRKIYKKSSIEINPGVTIFIGCNGSGKSTLIEIIKDDLKESGTPYYLYDNFKEGGSKRASVRASFGMESIVNALLINQLSEGEQINANIIDMGKDLFQYIESGASEEDQRMSRISKMLSDNYKEKVDPEHDQRWFLFDAIDSGYSIDNVVDFKEYILKPLIRQCAKHGKEAYIVVVANEYEMTVGEQSFNVVDGKYVDVSTYEKYKKQILKTREYKEKRDGD